MLRLKATAEWIKKVVKSEVVQAVLENQYPIELILNLALAPWWGGFYERMMGLVKNRLGRPWKTQD